MFFGKEYAGSIDDFAVGMDTKDGTALMTSLKEDGYYFQKMSTAPMCRHFDKSVELPIGFFAHKTRKEICEYIQSIAIMPEKIIPDTVLVRIVQTDKYRLNDTKGKGKVRSTMEPQKIDEIIEEPMTMDEITSMYRKEEICRNEWLLLTAVQDDGRFLRKYMLGVGEYKMNYDSTVDQRLYFTNIPAMLSAFYILYKKYPNYHFDEILAEGLRRLSNDEYSIYKFLKIFYEQLENEENNISPFKIIDKSILENCKIYLHEYKENLKKVKKYDASNRENGYMDVISDMNEVFKEKLGYDILGETLVEKQKHEEKKPVRKTKKNRKKKI